MKSKFVIAILIALILGLVIAWIDSRPNWDDSGISVFSVLIAGAICGLITPKSPWLVALLVSIWIPVFEIIASGGYGGIVAIVPGFIGAYATFFIKKSFQKK